MIDLASDHHPRFARRLLLVALAGALAVAALMSAASGASARTRSCPNATTPIVRAARPELQRAVVCLVNLQRTERHLPALVISPKLNLSAQRWTNAMVDQRDFSHGGAFSDRISAVGFDWTDAGENIATGYATPAAVVSAWMASPGHCANILDPQYREVGTGVDGGDILGGSSVDGTWTQDFGRLMNQPALSNDFGPAQACYR